MTPRAWQLLRRMTGSALVCLGLVWLARQDAAHGRAGPPVAAAFIGWILLIWGAVSSFFQAFGGFAGFLLQLAFTHLRAGVIALAGLLRSSLWDLGRFLSQTVGALKKIWSDVIRPFLSWANTKLLALEAWLKEKFAPLIKFLKDVKDHFDEFYKHYVKPITDTIDFIRGLNRILETFHIHLLSQLDKTLTQLEAKIDEPFQWVRDKITWVEGWIDRIVTADGLFQRLTLLRSMIAYEGEIIRNFWSAQLTHVSQEEVERRRQEKYQGADPAHPGQELKKFYTDGGGEFAGTIRELVPLWRISAGLDPGEVIPPEGA